MKKCYKFYWINFDGKVMKDYFTSEKAGFSWIERYGVEYFDHKTDYAPVEMILM